MKRTTISFLILFAVSWLSGCARPTSFSKGIQLTAPEQNFSTVSESAEPELILTASSQLGLAPLNVTFHAVLKNVASKDPNFTCLWQEWIFGDGRVSGEQRDCAASDTITIDTEFLSEHKYQFGGDYLVMFTLGEHRSNPVMIRVIDPLWQMTANLCRLLFAGVLLQDPAAQNDGCRHAIECVQEFLRPQVPRRRLITLCVNGCH